MSEFKKNFQRDTTDENRGPSSSAVMEEVKRLLRDPKTDYATMEELRKKHGVDMAGAVFDAYKKSLESITKKAKKFRQLINDKYAPMNLSFDEMMVKAKKYQRLYKLSDDEFNMFINLSLSDKVPSGHLFSLPSTSMARLLGYEAAMAVSDKLNVKDNELDTVQDILKLYGESRTLHSQVLMQSLVYRDCATEALKGSYSADKNNVYSYVHPIIAALFLPKINYLDEHMLIANIGYIVKCKYEGKPIMTKPDFELYWDMISDPNEYACSTVSSIKDLRNRYILQTKLWDNVLNLRQGKYFAPNLTEFLAAIDNCRSNVYDSPDLVYVKDEGTILRRMLAAFSIRPTIVTTTRLYNVLTGANFGFAANPLTASGITNMTTVPMVTLRLPLNITGATRAQTGVSLNEALSQPEMFVENKMIVPKTRSIVHSRDVMFFYVGRRFQTINITRLDNRPYNFLNLPVTVAGFEQLNERPVNFDFTMQVMNDTYTLRSVVFIERAKNRSNVIVGSSAGIITKADPSMGYYQETYLLYDPQGAGEMYRDPATNSWTNNPAIGTIPQFDQWAGNVESFHRRAATRGTIFMYEKTTSATTGPLFA